MFLNLQLNSKEVIKRCKKVKVRPKSNQILIVQMKKNLKKKKMESRKNKNRMERERKRRR